MGREKSGLLVAVIVAVVVVVVVMVVVEPGGGCWEGGGIPFKMDCILSMVCTAVDKSSTGVWMSRTSSVSMLVAGTSIATAGRAGIDGVGFMTVLRLRTAGSSVLVGATGWWSFSDILS